MDIETKVWDHVQLDAIGRCTNAKERIVPVTGRAGTGKTSIIEEVYNRLSDAGYEVACSAPTGKAAKRIKEATGIQAVTNHRLLGYGMPVEQEIETHDGKKKVVAVSSGPKYTRKQPMTWDYVLCDEYAMVNHELHRNLIDALKPRANIRMFGDVNQLRPIEEDRRLESELSPFETSLTKFRGIELTTNHRQLAGSGIAENGARVLAGRMPMRRDDFDIKYSDDPVKSLRVMVEEWAAVGKDISTPDHQIITTQNKSWVGTVRLNAMLQQMFWKREFPAFKLDRWKDDNAPVSIQIGSKVVYTANTYDIEVYNGEVGVVVEIDYGMGTIDIDFGDRVASIPPLVVSGDKKSGYREFDPRKNIDLAYALTTHKMQGSECDNIIYVLNKSTSFMQSRRNLYTGITRAKRHCTILTDVVSLNKSIRVTS